MMNNLIRKVAKFIQESRPQTNMEYWNAITSLIIPISYFFAGESFSKVNSRQSHFGLRTVLKDKFEHPSMGKILLRSVIKALHQFL